MSADLALTEPTEPWSISETRFEPRFLEQLETIYALGNGFLGLRGDFEEAMPVSKVFLQ